MERGGEFGERGHGAPGFEPPPDEGGGGPGIHGLSLVARIVRGRELATDAAGLPPLDSDQVLDLQRSAGNRLTAGALERWTGVLEEALHEEAHAALAAYATPEAAARRPPAELLDRLGVARAIDPRAHAAIAAALDARDPPVRVRLSCVAGALPRLPVRLAGPRGELGSVTADLAPGDTLTLTAPFGRLLGPAAELAPDAALTLTVDSVVVALPLPFVAPRALRTETARLVALAELGERWPGGAGSLAGVRPEGETRG